MADKCTGYKCKKCGYVQATDFNICPCCNYCHTFIRPPKESKIYTSDKQTEIYLKNQTKVS